MLSYTPQSVTEAVLAQMESTADERLKNIMQSAIRHLHAFAREVNLTPAEWLKAIEFLTRVGKTCTATRQEFILLSDVIGLSTLVNTLHDATALEKATSTSLLGPFFREDAPPLSIGEQISKADKSEEILLWGTVRNAAGEAIPNAKLMVWQTSSSGAYDLQEGGVAPSITAACSARTRRVDSICAPCGRWAIPFRWMVRSAIWSVPRAAKAIGLRIFIF
jgi:catechol 1,2-dioxygenase/hydroxyquinol 1,2-dioxygenase